MLKMKKNIKLFLCIALSALVATSAFAGNQEKKGKKGGWQEKVKAEKIAFLTSELDLTVAEAEAFWPVYNAMEKEKQELMESKFKTFKELNKAIAEEKSEEEITSLTKKFVEINSKVKEVDNKYFDKFSDVLPASKVAKVYLSEEKFRSRQINNLCKGDGDPRKHEGQAPGRERKGRRNGPEETKD